MKYSVKPLRSNGDKMLLGITAIGQFALGMLDYEIIVYEPVSKIGSAGSFNPNPIPVVTV